VRRLRARGALQVRGLCAGWGGSDLLRGLDLDLATGERVAVLGPNGAGKTTLFDAISGRLRPSAGAVRLGGADMTGWPLHRRARAGLAYVPQEPTALVGLSVRQNLEVAVAAPAARGAASRDVAPALKAWGLQALADREAAALSGGERRRMEVARALLLRPAVLLLDEPFAGLDPEGRAALARGLKELPAGVAMLVTDHAADDVLGSCDRVVVLVDGAVSFDGPVSSFEPTTAAWRRYFG